MKVVIYGAHGQVGEALVRHCTDESVELICLSRQDQGGDLLSLKELEERLLALSPDVIVNAAAYTKVDEAESHVDEAMVVNALAPEVMARCAKQMGTLLIHFGTDYVFNGTGDRAWRENDMSSPINVYGRTKLAGESAVIRSGCRYVILRVSWVHAPGHKNFITSLMTWLKSRPVVDVVSDQWGSPTSADEIARGVRAVIGRAINDKHVDGIYHFTNAGVTNRYQCALFVAELLGEELSRVRAVDSFAFTLPAKRPLNCRLSTSKFSKVFAFEFQSWQEGVKATVLKTMA